MGMRWVAVCALLVACSDPPSAPRVTRTEQAIDGMPVYHRARRELRDGNGRVVMATERRLDPRTPRTPNVFVDDEPRAIAKAAAGAFVERARARKFWVPYANKLVAAWVVEAYTSDPFSTVSDLVRVVIAGDGRVLSRESLVADSTFTYRVYAETGGEQRPYDSPFGDTVPHPTGLPDNQAYSYVPPQDVTISGGLNSADDPWLPADATSTRGNNIDAYVDIVAPSGLDDGDFRATAVGTTFPYSYDPNDGPLADTEQQMAAVTSLFYTLNWLHDFWYDAGFDEAAGNAQASNYGRGGMEQDAMLAEAQDNALDGSRNNANMSTPDDGMPPRMQVFLWNGKDDRELALSPSGRTPSIGVASFGPREFDLDGAIVLGQDSTGANPNDGCEPFTNDVAGKLVLVDRGNCTYKTKTTNAQNGSALAVIIANNVEADNPPSMGDDPNLADPLIPSVSITQPEGATIKAELGSAVTASLARSVGVDLDGSLDSTLVAHEFGHYLHHRLSVCDNAMCRAMSEGWGDFVALLLLAREDDNLRGAYPFSVYPTQGYPIDPMYFGIRRAPYSVDPSINALSFRHMSRGEPLPTHPMRPSASGNNEIHNAGEVWTAALWEAYVALQEAAPADQSFLAVRTKMARYIVTGLQLAPEEASPLEVRDAILAAALAASRTDYEVILAAFARRGFGSCAISAPPASVTFNGIVESTIVSGNPQMSTYSIDDACDGDGIIDTGETATFKLKVTNQGHSALTDATIVATSQIPGVTVLTPALHRDSIDIFESLDLDVRVALDAGIGDAIEGDVMLQVTSAGGCVETVSIPIAQRLNVDDVQDGSATDRFDAFLSYWEPWVIAWRHERPTPLNGIWHGDDLALASDTRLTSPELTVADDKPLTISFDHRYQFEQADDTNWDGAVVEYSLDGETWVDVVELADPSYSGVISNRSGNELGDRPGYVGTNAAWPEYERVTLELGDVLRGKPFRLRFRIGTDSGTGAHGWDIDNVAFSGIVGTPFPIQVSDDGVCDPTKDDPILTGGGGCCQTGPAGGAGNAALSLVLLVLLGRRRTRARA